MDLIKLNANMQSSKLIENYDSLIWTERYNTIGDFQLMTGNVDEYMELLPEGTVLSLRESTVPMIVETHEITRPKNSAASLKITGRDFCSVLDRRVAIQSITADLPPWTVVAKIPSDIAHYIIYKIVVEGILDAKDIFPPSQFQLITPSDYLATPGPNRQWGVPRGKLLSAVLGYLQTESKADPTTTPPSPAVVPHGIRAIRPAASGTAIGVQIYVGVDRSAEITFDATKDLLDDGKYLFSKVGMATDDYAIAKTSAYKVVKGDVSPSGFDRRVILTEDATEVADVLVNKAKRELSLAHETAIFDGSINQDLSTYIYNVHYGLGDVVNLVGDYGLEEKARVTEYIRSEDKTGSKSYPTLTSIDRDNEGA